MAVPKRGANYSEAELEILDQLVDCYPGPELVERYQAIAKEKGLPQRSAWSIKKKVWYSYGSIRPTLKNFCARELCRILGFHPRRAYRWIREGKLKPAKAGKVHKITPASLRRFARKYPYLLREADRDRLVFLFGEEFADKIKATPRHRRHGVPVRHKKTGEVFRTTQLASKVHGVAESTIRNQIWRGNGPWERIDREKESA